LGYRPVEAGNGKEALAVLDTEPEIVTALLDRRLPDMDGVDLAKALRAKRPALHLVIASGQSVADSSLAEIPGSKVGMLLKPFNALQLERLLFQELE
jgi:DNA-binding NtrC family response regulator